MVRTITFVNTPDDAPNLTCPFAKLLPKDIDGFVDLLSEGPASKVISLIEGNRFARRAAFDLASVLGVRISEKDFQSMYHSFLGRRKENATAFKAMIEYGRAIGDMMADIDVPVLVIGAKKDFFVDVSAAWRMHLGIWGSEIAIFEDSTHAPMIEEHERFNSILLGFLHRYSPSRLFISNPGG